MIDIVKECLLTANGQDGSIFSRGIFPSSKDAIPVDAKWDIIRPRDLNNIPTFASMTHYNLLDGVEKF
jgi:hypothetical protein